MGKRAVRLIGYPVTAWFAGLTAWATSARFIAEGCRTPDILWLASFHTAFVLALCVAVTEWIARNAEETPRA